MSSDARGASGAPSPEPVSIRLDVPADIRYLNVVGACARALLERAPGVKEAEILYYNVELALQEVCTNIVQHAYGGKRSATARIDLGFTYSERERLLTIELVDTGQPFDTGEVPEPLLDEAQVHGYGLFLVRNLMDEVTYSSSPAGNCWRLLKKLD